MKDRILVVDDDSRVRMMLCTWLEHAGYHTTQAPDGESALLLLETEVFDVVLTDIVMGTVSGIDVLLAARRQSYCPEVILLTGHASLETAIAALRKGARDYLLKPCPAKQLLDHVQYAVQCHIREKQIREATSTLVTALSLKQVVEEETSILIGELRADQCVDTIQLGEISLGANRQEVLFQNRSVQLTSTEFALLRYLLERRGQICCYRDIVRATHFLDMDDHEARLLLRPHVRNLRKKLSSSCIINERGIGYKFP